MAGGSRPQCVLERSRRQAMLTDPLFWQLYYRLEMEGLSDEDVARQLRGLPRHFPVRLDEETETHLVEFSLPCPGGFDLFLEYEPDAFGSSITLYLRHAASGAKGQMGWWDLARWCPYCLHPDELDLLLDYWSNVASGGPDARIALLLLARFVGLCDEATRRVLSDRVNAAYRELCHGASGHLPLSLEIETDHQWVRDEQLGWLFEADYAGCSLRNRAHKESGEEQFPFAQFQIMWNSLQS